VIVTGQHPHGESDVFGETWAKVGDLNTLWRIGRQLNGEIWSTRQCISINISAWSLYCRSLTIFR